MRLASAKLTQDTTERKRQIFEAAKNIAMGRAEGCKNMKSIYIAPCAAAGAIPLPLASLPALSYQINRAAGDYCDVFGFGDQADDFKESLKEYCSNAMPALLKQACAASGSCQLASYFIPPPFGLMVNGAIGSTSAARCANIMLDQIIQFLTLCCTHQYAMTHDPTRVAAPTTYEVVAEAMKAVDDEKSEFGRHVLNMYHKVSGLVGKSE